jgi:Fe-S cluster biogenesis protein NfuA
MSDDDDRPSGLAAGLGAVRALLGPDGGDVAVTGWDEASGTLALRLELESAECAECIVPRPMLDTLLLTSLKEHAPAVAAIDLDDPRDQDPGDTR